MGTMPLKWTVVTDILSDGSVVYNITEGDVVLHAPSKKIAETVAYMLNECKIK